MKKLFTLMLLAMACSVTLQAQEYNLFDAADVDADGWLWFDTDEKIEKYIGVCDEDNYKVDPNGKPIQLVYADIMPDYPAPTTDSWFVGAGTDGEVGTEGCKTGAIILPAASAMMATNGGGIAVMMPSCKTFSLCLSKDGRAMVRMLASKDINTTFTDYYVISAAYASMFKPLFRSGIYTWTGIETLDNGNDGAWNMQTDAPIYGYLQNVNNAELWIHGIKVTTSTAPTGIEEETVAGKDKIFFFNNTVSLNEEAQIEVYNIAGVMVESAFASKLSLDDMNKGIYIVKVGNNVRKVAVK